MVQIPAHETAKAKGVRNKEPLLYIYTSGTQPSFLSLRTHTQTNKHTGTTGLPKAAIVDHMRIYSVGLGYAGYLNATKDDRWYLCLPMWYVRRCWSLSVFVS